MESMIKLIISIIARVLTIITKATVKELNQRAQLANAPSSLASALLLVLGGFFVVFILLIPNLLPILIIIGAGFLIIKKGYAQAAISWFFLKENESNGTALTHKEIASRITKTINQLSKIEKAILASLAIFAALICAILLIVIIVRFAS